MLLLSHGVRLERKCESKANSGGVETNETPAWLPHGWIVEVKARGGSTRGRSTYKNTPSRTTRRSSSRKDVSEDQKSIKAESGTTKNEKSSSSKPSTEIVCAGVVESNSIYGLPAGWITEYRTRSCGSGTKRDLYYTDPANGYAFRSKKDLYRYLETGDIRKCAMRPKKRDEYNDSEFTKAVTANTPSEKSLPKDVSEPLASTKGQSSTSKKKQNEISKTSTDIVPYDVTATPVVDELPPGWIREIQ